MQAKNSKFARKDRKAMQTTTEQHVILGAGPLGQAVMRALVRRGTPVRMVNRSGKLPLNLPAEVELAGADLYQPDEVRRVTREAAVVYHCASPAYAQWTQHFPALQASLLTGLRGSRARLVVGDNLYMYGPVVGRIHEDLPYAAQTKKGSLRARLAEGLLEAHAQGQVQVTIGRGSDFFGPGVRGSLAGEQVFGALAQDKPAALLGDVDQPHTYTFIDDFGEALVALGARDEALGQAWHVPNAETISTRQFVTLAAEALGVQPRMMVAGALIMRVLGLFTPAVRESIEMAYQVTRPFVVDDSRYKQAFGDHSTPLSAAVRQTAAWFQNPAGGEHNPRTANPESA
jgi:nucleoside-diphosphate-sugar epimerase